MLKSKHQVNKGFFLMKNEYKLSTTVSYVTGALILCLRELKGIKQLELARNIEMSTSGISKLETGETNISSEQFFILSKQFDIEASELMFLLEISIKAVNRTNIFVSNTKSKAVTVEKTSDAPAIMVLTGLLGLATGSPLAALGIAAASGLIVQNNEVNKKNLEKKETINLVTEVKTLKGIIFSDVKTQYNSFLQKKAL